MDVLEQLLASFNMMTLLIVIAIWFCASVYLMYWAIRKMIERVETPDETENHNWRMSRINDYWN